MARLIVGIDVAKDSLDAYVRRDRRRLSVPNTDAGVVELVAWVRHTSPSGRVRIDRPLPQAVVAALLAGHCRRSSSTPAGSATSPRRWDARQDRRDRRAVSPTSATRCRHREAPRPAGPPGIAGLFRPPPPARQMLAAEKNHRHAAERNVPSAVAASTPHPLAPRADQGPSNAGWTGSVETSEAFREAEHPAASITGVGPQVARTLIAHLPELGQRTGSRSRLVGLARSTTTAPHRPASHPRRTGPKVRIGLYQRRSPRSDTARNEGRVRPPEAGARRLKSPSSPSPQKSSSSPTPVRDKKTPSGPGNSVL